MKLVATSIAALGLMAAPLAAQEASQAPAVKSAGVAQQAQLSQATVLGVPPLIIGVGVATAVVIGAVAISNSNDNDSTPGTR
ncbi:hypothetical protein [Albimonas pacifica]|uniref:Secreted protein n=1 Tax=Albimonas pacifica TaxID=1114924 RepID=A0A1I3IP01_9RHOB|nr:hypothetical protein [Albimonas pacifica]SFI49642.1 hypothetical protein SAMN05216258_107155 [Albimonas pacifica]